MKTGEICELVGRLMREPTVPYHEHGVRRAVEAILSETGIAFTRDRFGNVLALVQTDANQRPIVFSAHLDHPGFEITQTLGKGRFSARFRGGVPEAYFKPGVRVRIYPGGSGGVLGERLQEKVYVIEAEEKLEGRPSFAVWDVEDFVVRRGRIIGRACDDLVGASSILAVLGELKASGALVNALGVFTRAEEVGFHGALALAAEKTLPGNALIISLETSRELPGCSMNKGVILRVGDRASTFGDRAGRFLAEIAADLAKDGEFRFQRALMSGGTCEGTAYQGMGYETAAVCVALGNYHNAADKEKIEAEFVAVNDVADMITLLRGAALRMADGAELEGRLSARLRNLLAEALDQLPLTANGDEPPDRVT